VIVALLARLHPRHWDGQRFLQFLTGLALLALASAAPLAPAGAAPVTPAPAAVLAAPAAETVAVDEPAAAVAVDEPAPAIAVDEPVAAVAVDEPAVVPAAPAVETGRHDASGYRPVLPPADTTTALTGVEQRAHGSRGPPRA
jgi:hypothetical protein